LITVNAIFTIVSGILCAIALAMVIGRLERTYFKVPLAALGALYFYAAIQPLFPLLRTVDAVGSFGAPLITMQCILKASSMALKYLLYRRVSELLRAGRMCFFLEEIRKLHDTAEERWAAFEEQYLRPVAADVVVSLPGGAMDAPATAT
jgi:hypothetical protein